jgi:hypothetical protein
MVRHITSKAMIDSSDSDENDDSAARLVDEDELSDSDSSSESSETSEGGEGGLLANTIDKILVEKPKTKGKQKQKAGAESECLPRAWACIYAANIICTIATETTGNEMDSEFAKKFTFNIAMFPAKERSKDLKKRTDKNTYMTLNNNEPFDTWNAQLLVKIDKTLNPSKLNIDDYEIHFTIPRISPSPLVVSSNEEYANMLERVSKSKNLTCNVYIQELHSSSKVGGSSFLGVSWFEGY